MAYNINELEYIYPFSLQSFELTVGDRLCLNHILKYQQQAGEEHLKCFDMGFTRLFEQKLVFVVTNTAVKINRLPKYDENIKLVTWNRGTKGAKFYRSYNWYTESGELLIESSTVFVLVDTDEHKIRRPDSISLTMPFDFDKQNAAGNPKKIFLPDANEMKKVGERKIVFSEIDINGHLNNSYYTDFVTDYTDDIMNKQVKSFSIDFVGEAKLGDTVDVYSCEKDGVTYFYGTHGRGVCFRASCIYA